MGKIATYYGKPLDKYTKAELIQIVCELGEMYNQTLTRHMDELDKISSWKKPSFWQRFKSRGAEKE